MFKRISALLVIGVMGGSLLLAGSATAAQARPDSARMAAGSDFLDPEIAVVGRRPVTVTVNDKIAVVSSHPEGPSDLTLTALPPDPKSMRSKEFKFVKVEKGDTSQTWTFSGSFTRDDPVGRWFLSFTAKYADGTSVTAGVPYYVYHATRIVDFGAHPWIVRKGHKIYFSGRLLHSVHGRWVPAAGARLSIYNKAQVKVADTTVTNRRGEFFAGVNADATDSYYALFPTEPDVFSPMDRMNAGSQSRLVTVRVRPPD